VFAASEVRAETRVAHRVVAYRNQTPPAGAPGEQFSSFGAPSLNDAGDVAFGSTTKTGLAIRSGLYAARVPGPLRVVARDDDPAPGVSGAVFDWVKQTPFLDEAGGVGFDAVLLRGTGGVTYGNEYGVWGPGPDGSLVLLVRSGQSAGGVAGTFAGSFGHEGVLGPAGLVFTASVKDASGVALGGGYWTASADASGVSQRLVAFQSQPMPGGPPGAVLAGTSTASMNALGQVALRALYRVEGPTRDGHGVWGPGADGELAPLALEGDAIPGAPTGTTYLDLSGAHPRINGLGEIAFSFGDGVVGPDGAGGLRLVAGAGQDAPGLPGLGIGRAEWPNLNDAGELAFRAQLVDAAAGATLLPEVDEAVFGPDGAGGARLVAREGDAVPEVPGAVMRDLTWPAINELGDVVFTARLLDGTEPDATEIGQAVFLATKGNHLVPVLRTGDVVFVAPDDPRPVLYFEIADAYNLPGSTRALNDRRQLAIATDALVLLSSVTIPGCQNGLDDDGDSGIDWDGGAAFHGGVAVAEPDERCAGDPERQEAASCGLGSELALLLPILASLRRRAAATGARDHAA
jgi:hypothetical protein